MIRYKRLGLLCAAGALITPALPAAAQEGPAPVIAADHTLLTVSAQGSSARVPDMATYSAGVTTQGATASEALGANSTRMTQVIAALRRAGIAEKDIQTSNLNLNPVYAQPKRLSDGSVQDEQPRRIVSYEATNTVTIRQRKLADTGRVIDALVAAGANQVNGPSFALSEPDAAQDEARLAAIRNARARAQLYAGAAGLKVLRIVSIDEGGGYSVQPVMFAAKRADFAAAPPPPVSAGELETSANITVRFELAP